MVTLLLGRAGTGKTSRVMDEFAACVRNNHKHLYYIVPEQYSHDAERLLLKVCGEKLSLYGEVLSFTRLAGRVFAETGGVGASLLDNGGRILMMSRALEAVSGSLEAYSRAEQRADFLENLVAAVKELKSACITPSGLEAAAEKAPSPLREKLGDLSLLMAAYDGFFDSELADPDDRLNKLAEAVGGSTLFDSGHIWIDGFTDFTEQELRVIKALMRCDAALTVCLTCDGVDGEDEIFEAPRKTARLLSRIAQDNGREVQILTADGSSKRNPALCFLEANLFRRNDVRYCAHAGNTGIAGDIGDAVRVIRAGTPGEECEAAAAEVLALVRDGCRWRDIAVSVCDADTYGVLAENTFEKYGIPFFVSKKSEIGHKPPVALIEGALDIVVNGWDCTSVFRYLKTGMTGCTPSDCDILENYALTWNFRGSVWTRSEDWTLPPSGYNQEPAAEDQILLERVNGLRRTVVTPVAVFQKALGRSTLFEGKLRALYQFLVDIGMADSIMNKAAALTAAGDIQLADEYKQLWDIIVRALDQFYAIAGSVRGSNADFARCWKLLISQYDVGSIPVALDRVGLGELKRQRRRDIKALIVVGATDDVLPGAGRPGGILSDGERRELDRLGLRLAGTAEERLYRDLNAVYTALTLPSDRLVLTYPARGYNGGEKRLSAIVRRLLTLLDLKEQTVNPDDCRLNAPVPCFELAVSYSAKPGDPAAAAAFAWCREDPPMAARLARIKEATVMGRGSLTAAGARRLYGQELSMSASRVDKFYACRYLYFLQYGLNAQPRKPAGFDAPTAGTFMHYVLENVVRDIRDAGGFQDPALTDDDCQALTDKYIGRYVDEVLDSFKDKSSRFQYLFNRLRRDTAFIVLDMVRELRRSDFTPLDFELEFSDRGALPAHALNDGEVRLKVKGFVDRLDGWEKDGKLYLRIVDYKTGKKAFSLSDVWYGMNMQMLIYLFTLAEHGKALYGKEIVPAGVLYAPAREEILPASRYISDGELENQRARKHRRSGLVLDDISVLEAMEHGTDKQYIPVKASRETGESLARLEQLGALSAHIDRLLLGIAASVKGGSIEAVPYYKNKTENACQFCDYRSACHFSEKDGDKRRYLKKLKPFEAWDMIEKGGQS
jgi:ATP-dependent helicase/nuclease subunit B